MIEFKSMGHEANAHGWKVIVRNGAAELISDGSGAYFGAADESPWCEGYSATELRDLAEMFAAAANLLEQVPPVKSVTRSALTLEQLIGFPEGSVVLDGDKEKWVKRSDGMWGYLSMSTTGFQGHTSKYIMQWGDVTCAK